MHIAQRPAPRLELGTATGASNMTSNMTRVLASLAFLGLGGLFLAHSAWNTQPSDVTLALAVAGTMLQFQIPAVDWATVNGSQPS